MTQKQCVHVALSGGVDSAVVAAILKESGYTVKGIYMKNWSDGLGIVGSCPWEQDLADVESIAGHLGIPWGVYNFEREYRERVLEYFFTEYKEGRTPNPDVLCNNLVKFALFRERSLNEGAEYIATGHYARRESPNPFPWENIGEVSLWTGLDPLKDQSYFLQRVNAMQLAHATFPIGGLLKSQVRALAEYLGLPNAKKKDSQGICFVGSVDVREFLRKNLHTRSGEIRDIMTEEIVGRHSGLWFYTIGQREGIGVGGKDPAYYVVKKDAVNNILWVGQGHGHPLLQAQRIRVHGLQWCGPRQESGTAYAAIRYREEPRQAQLVVDLDNTDCADLTATDKPFWAPAAGQMVQLLAGPLSNEVKSMTEIPGEILASLRNSSKNRYVRVIGSGVIT